MKRIGPIILLLFLASLISNLMAQEVEKTQEKSTSGIKAFIIPLRDMIDGGLHSSMERRVEAALKESPRLIIFEIDTYGGRLEPAFDISEYLLKIDKARTVAYIPSKAISAGSLITLACNEIVMGPQAELGDCEPIIPAMEGGYQTAGEKIQTLLRTKFRKFADKNGYPILLAEAMVTKEMEVYQIFTEEAPQGRFITSKELKDMTQEEAGRIKSKRLIVEAGKLLTMHAKEAREYGFARAIVENRKELLELYGLKPEEVVDMETNWSEDMVRFLDGIAPILLSVGLIALWLELKAPGFGLPGIIGVSCLATVFLSKYLVGLAEATEMLVFLLGVMLLAVEVFLLPGFGLAGLTGILLMLMGTTLAFQDFVVPQTPYHYEELRGNLLKILSSMAVSLLAMMLMVKYLPGMPLFGRLVLRASEEAELGFGTTLAIPTAGLTGRYGYALSTLRPSGRAEFNGEVLDVVTQGEFVERGRKVEIVEVRGNRVIVRPV
jgi:membrane-bound serine protease (ClpP class)